MDAVATAVELLGAKNSVQQEKLSLSLLKQAQKQEQAVLQIVSQGSPGGAQASAPTGAGGGTLGASLDTSA